MRGHFLRASLASGPTDPYFANVSFLLQPTTEADGSTVFTDKSSNNLAISTVGSPAWSAGVTLFGLPTMLLNGSQHLRLPKSAAALAFGSSDFTIEAWVLRSSTGNQAVYVGQGDLATAAGSSIVTYLASTATSDLYVGSTARGAASPNPGTGSFVFVQWVRSGGTWQTRLSGSIVATNSSVGSGSVNAGGTTYFPTIGRFDTNTNGLTGRIAALRITKGVARVATVPSAPFPTR